MPPPPGSWPHAYGQGRLALTSGGVWATRLGGCRGTQPIGRGQKSAWPNFGRRFPIPQIMLSLILSFGKFQNASASVSFRFLVQPLEPRNKRGREKPPLGAPPPTLCWGTSCPSLGGLRPSNPPSPMEQAAPCMHEHGAGVAGAWEYHGICTVTWWGKPEPPWHGMGLIHPPWADDTMA